MSEDLKILKRKICLSVASQVDLLYNGVRDNILENDLTLLDVAFIFKLNKVCELFHFIQSPAL